MRVAWIALFLLGATGGCMPPAEQQRLEAEARLSHSLALVRKCPRDEGYVFRSPDGHFYYSRYPSAHTGVTMLGSGVTPQEFC